jgi:release factor glutamine methyltransferase
MSASASSPPLSAIVTRLRAAGCVFAEDEARLLISAASTPADLAAMVDRRAAGLPLEHVVGWAEFCGLRIAVDPGVFVPRRRSEFLVRQAADLARGPASPPDRALSPASQATAGFPGQAPARQASASRPGPAGPPVAIVDLCCGSGALGAALTAALGRAELHAADIDPAAVRCARRNLAAFGGRVYEGDLFQPLPPTLRGRVDILLANVPYVPTDAVRTLPPEARLHEARLALDGGPDGLDVLRRVAAAAPLWLAPGGHLLIETSERQALRAAQAFTLEGLAARVVSSADLNATVVIGTRPARPAGRDG